LLVKHGGESETVSLNQVVQDWLKALDLSVPTRSGKDTNGAHDRNAEAPCRFASVRFVEQQAGRRALSGKGNRLRFALVEESQQKVQHRSGLWSGGLNPTGAESFSNLQNDGLCAGSLDFSLDGRGDQKIIELSSK